MKKVLIASLVAALVLFFYQAASWMFLPTHKNFSKHAIAPNEALDVLSKNMPEDGIYYLPMPAENATPEEEKKFMEISEGKPWAMVSYHKAMDISMGKNMAIGITLQLLSALLIAFVIYSGSESFQTFSIRFIVAASFYLFATFNVRLVDWNWWDTPMHYLAGDLIDAAVSAIICGSWMGWYFGRGAKASTSGIR